MATIEELKPEFFPLVAEWLSNPAINQWLDGDWRGRSINSSLVAVTVRNRRNRLFLVRSDATPCGVVALADIEVADRLAMVWYLMGDAAFTGRGIISDALSQIVAFGFDELALECIYAWVMQNNTRSIRVLVKSGFRQMGCLRRSACFHGKQVDRIYFDSVRHL